MFGQAELKADLSAICQQLVPVDTSSPYDKRT